MPLAAEAPARTMTRLGRYDLLLRIGSGGMAEVWAARLEGQGGFQRLVAIKTIRPEIEQESRAREMFLDEARIAASIHHPNVCGIFELGEEEAVLYLVMEWINGESLHALCRPDGRPSSPGGGSDDLVTIEPRMAARILVDACAGLHACHELTDDDGKPLEVVHRDVSPHNILIGLDGVVKVTDFGVAKAKNRSHKTKTGDIKGKPAYMPPEQLRAEPMDRRADVYALGCVLFEMTTGRRLFEGEDVQVAAQSLVLEAPPPSTHVPDYPPELERIVVKAVARAKEDRFASAEELRHALEAFLASSGPPISQEEIANLVKTRLGDRIRARREAIRRAAAAEGPRDHGMRGDSVTPTGARRAVGRLVSEPPPPMGSSEREVAGDAEASGERAPVPTSVEPPPRSARGLVFGIGAGALVVGGVLGAILFGTRVSGGGGSPSASVPAATPSLTSAEPRPSVTASATSIASGVASSAPSASARSRPSATATVGTGAPHSSGVASASAKPRPSADPPPNPSSLPNPYPESP